MNRFVTKMNNVHFSIGAMGVGQLNTVVTSREDILRASRELIRREGVSVLGMRSVAAACSVSVGSIYNYFDSKADLISAAVESVWHEIFHREADAAAFRDALACIVWMYDRMEDGSKRYPGFFTLHALGFMQEGKAGGKQQMASVWRHIVDELCVVLRSDAGVRSGAFTDRLTVERLADTILSLMVSAMMRGQYDPDAVLEIVRRVLY